MSDTQKEVSAEHEKEYVPPVAEPQVQFYVTNESGAVVRSGECPESLVQLQAFGAGEIVHRGEEPKAEHEEATFTHEAVRAPQYPTVQEQLGAIWKILARNPEALGEEGAAMLQRIQNVKEAIPKDCIYKQTVDVENADVRYIPVEK